MYFLAYFPFMWKKINFVEENYERIDDKYRKSRYFEYPENSLVTTKFIKKI